VIVYAGAVMVLYVFVVAYVGGSGEPLAGPVGPGLKVASLIFAGALFVELAIAVIGTGLKGMDGEGTPYRTGFGTPGEIGALFLTKFLIAFEVASLLLLVAAVGAVILARRRTVAAGVAEISVGQLMRGDVGTLGRSRAETQIEAGGPAQR
jgi:NADH:ubiquinone oxidoreductase subunit 6 (subunit J)